MNQQDIDRLFIRQKVGGPIQDMHEWRSLLPKILHALVDRASYTPWDTMPIIYKDLGTKIGLPYIPDYLWWPLKMAVLLGACAEYERRQGRPMITSIVVNGETGRPGQGFWTLEGIPPRLRIVGGVRSQDYLSGMERDSRREEFWVKEMRKVNDFWKSHQGGSSAQKAN